MLKVKKYIYFIIILTLMFSCISNKKIAYFQYDSIDDKKVTNNYVTIFKPDDLLQIMVSAKDMLSVKPFNLSVVNYSGSTNGVIGEPQQQEYLIDSKGEIDFPILGKIKLGGLTREQAITLIKKKLDPLHVKNPSINIRITNFTVTVTGDVRSPNSFLIRNERVSIIDAIGLAGDLNITGRRDNVSVIREENNTKKIYRVNLLSKKTYTSPVFYLQQNDIIYVEHNKAKIQSASYNQNTGLFISIGSILISLMSVLIR
ncbi:MAG: polysaccharide biosynthesis/export family protein [Polaribacter sp.]